MARTLQLLDDDALNPEPKASVVDYKFCYSSATAEIEREQLDTWPRHGTSAIRTL
jgi:hypothetical protein